MKTSTLIAADYELWPFVIRMKLPTKMLHPNASLPLRNAHLWRLRRSTEIKRYRHAAGTLTRFRMAMSLGLGEPWKAAHAQLVFFWPSLRNKRDPDNLLAAMKSAFDGVTDGGLIAGDRNLTHLPVIQTADASHPRVELWMRPS